MPTSGSELLRRIIPKIESTRPGECWVWKGATLNKYTPCISNGKKPIRVTRFLLGLKIGRELTADEEARRSCDNPSKLCVNPQHLYVSQR